MGSPLRPGLLPLEGVQHLVAQGRVTCGALGQPQRLKVVPSSLHEFLLDYGGAAHEPGADVGSTCKGEGGREALNGRASLAHEVSLAHEPGADETPREPVFSLRKNAGDAAHEHGGGGSGRKETKEEVASSTEARVGGGKGQYASVWLGYEAGNLTPSHSSLDPTRL